MIAEDQFVAYVVPDVLENRPNPQAGQMSAKAMGTFSVQPNEVELIRVEYANAAEAGLTFESGRRCEVVHVHHAMTNHYLGRRFVITKVDARMQQVWVHEDRPVRYKLNRKGRSIVDYDPRCDQTVFGFEQLRLLT